MQEQTKNKLSILVNTGKIQNSDLLFLNEVDQDVSIYDNGDIEEMLLIHIAMAFSRQRDDTIVDAMPEELWEQITSKPEFQKAKQYWSTKKLKAPIKLDEHENQYIIMHLVNILAKGGN